MIRREVIFSFLEETGREVSGGREELTLREVYESYGGYRSGATARLARELGVTQRQAQRLVTEHGTERRGFGPKSRRYFRQISDRELRRVGARFLRDNPLVFAQGSTFEMCYGDDDEGEREVQGDEVSIDNGPWLDHFDAADAAETRGDRAAAEREYNRMARVFSDLFLEAYGVSAGDLDICDEDGGQNLQIAH